MRRGWMGGLAVIVFGGRLLSGAGSLGCAQVIGLGSFIDCPGDPTCPADATCHDGMKDGAETDVDCGGPCSKCAIGQGCSTGSDCTSRVCMNGTCIESSCDDKAKNGNETDIDCGGPMCPGCGPGEKCNENADCKGSLCVGGTCAPTCTDGVKNGEETGVDCGGPTCPTCTEGGCTTDVDCSSGICQKGSCAPVDAWSRDFSDPSVNANDISPFAVATDSTNNVILAGVFASARDFGSGSATTPKGSSDGFVAKFDAVGNYVWNRDYGDTQGTGGIALVSAIAVGSLDDIVLTGSFTGSVSVYGPVLSAPSNGTDIIVAKIDSFGNGQWAKAFGVSGNNQGSAIAVDAAGGIVVGGQMGGTVDFGGSVVTSIGPTNAFVAKFEPDGTLDWANAYGDAQLHQVMAIAVDGVGNILLAGLTQGTIDFGGNAMKCSGLDTCAYVAKLDPSGAYVWSVLIGGMQHDPRVAVDSSGDVFFAGDFSGKADFGNGMMVSSAGTMGAPDLFLVKYDPSGNYLWGKQFGDQWVQQAARVAVDLSGKPILTSQCAGTVNFGGGPLTSAGGPTGGADIFIAKFDTAGNHLWSRRFGDNAEQDNRALAVDTTGAALIAGLFDGTLNFGDKPLVNMGGTDMFLAKLNTP